MLRKKLSYKAKYVNGMKILMALIKSTANNIKTTTENTIPRIGDMARADMTNNSYYIKYLLHVGSQDFREYSPLSVII